MSVSIEGDWSNDAYTLAFDQDTQQWVWGGTPVDFALLNMVPSTHGNKHGFEIQVGIFDQVGRVVKRLAWINVTEDDDADVEDVRFDDVEDEDLYCGRCGQRLPDVAP